MAQIIRATEFVRSFSDIMNRVYYKGESFDVQKGNHIVARITPVHAADKPKKTLKEFFEHAPILDPEDAAQFKKKSCMKHVKNMILKEMINGSSD